MDSAKTCIPGLLDGGRRILLPGNTGSIRRSVVAHVVAFDLAQHAPAGAYSGGARARGHVTVRLSSFATMFDRYKRRAGRGDVPQPAQHWDRVYRRDNGFGQGAFVGKIHHIKPVLTAKTCGA